MVDTLRLTFPRYEVSDHPDLEVKPAVVNLRTGESKGDFPLFRRSSGDWVTGKVAYHNADDFQFELSGGSTFPRATVQLSLCGYGQKSNVNPIPRGEVLSVMGRLDANLKDIGVRADLTTAVVSRLDLARNVESLEPFDRYSPVFRMLRFARTRNRREFAGQGYLWGSGASGEQMVTYDKIQDLKHKKLDTSSLPSNLIRFELRELEPLSCSKRFGVTNVKSLVNRYDDLPERYRSRVKELFRFESDDLVSVDLQAFSNVLERKRVEHPRTWVRHTIEYFGTRSLLTLAHGELESLANVVESVAGNRMASSRFRSLMRSELMQSGLTVSSIPLSVLYDELRSKVLAA